MSTSITIPKRNDTADAQITSSPTSTNSSASSSPTLEQASVSDHPTVKFVEIRYTAKEKGKAPVRSNVGHERRVSLLSSSISKSEHTVINIGDEDAPRLITCVKASQGFDWNQDIFLPSYAADHDYSADLERRQDPVQDIIITDEEVEEMFPR